MKKLFLLMGFFGFALTATESCKSKKKETPSVQTKDAVEISTDDQLRTSVDNVVRAYADVKADVKDGVVTLKGTIKRDDLQTLIMRVQELKPKKVENQLIIQ